MAEAVALAASVIAVVQLAERVTKICKFYFESLADEYPKDLRLIYVEVGSLKVILEGLSLLDPADPSERATLQALHDGPVQQCKNAIEELVKISLPTRLPLQLA